MGPVAVIVVRRRHVGDEVRPDDRLGIQLFVRCVDARIKDAHVRARPSEPGSRTSCLHAVVRPRGIHRDRDLRVVIDANDTRRRRESADLPVGQVGREAVDDAQLPRDGEWSDATAHAGEREGTVGRHHHRMSTPRFGLAQATLEHVVEAIPIRVGESYPAGAGVVLARRGPDRGRRNRQRQRQRAHDNDTTHLRGTLLPGRR